MKTNTNTELDTIRLRLLDAFQEPNDKLEYNGNDSTRNTDELLALIDQYVHQREVLARIDELQNTFVSYDNALASTLVAKPEWEYGQATERIAELEASLKTERGE